MKYAVRCCCQPQKVFGWLELPAGLRSGDRLPLRPRISAFDRRAYESTIPEPETILIRTLNEVVDGKVRSELAVYSEDRPAEFWRGLPNFTPADP